MTKKHDPRHTFWVEYLELGAEEDLAQALKEGAVDTTVLVALRNEATGHDGPIAVEVRQIEGAGLCVAVVDSEFPPIEPVKEFNLPVESLNYSFLTSEWLDANCEDFYLRAHAIELHWALRWRLGLKDVPVRRDQFRQPRGNRRDGGKRHEQKGDTRKGVKAEKSPAPQVPVIERSSAPPSQTPQMSKEPSKKQGVGHGTSLGHGLDALAVLLPQAGDGGESPTLH
jgi:hypothetical protein